MEENFIKFFMMYLKKHLINIIFMVCFISVFFVLFYLYGLPTEPIVYGAVLSLPVALLLFLTGIFIDYKKHKALRESLENINISMEDLPAPNNFIEQDYEELIESIFLEKSKIEQNYVISEKELSDYFTMWVHQIKTPISAMKLLLQGEETSEKSAILSSELFKIEQYVEMVLGYLRLDSEYTDYIIREYELNDIVKQSIRKYAKIFILKKIQLDYDELSFKVITDEKWLLFALDQLISNALKYTATGKISIYMEGDSTLVIKDTGMGIQAEDLPRVFEKGFTGLNGRIDKKSTGLGLYLCKRTLNKLSHKIQITSEIGHGTYVRLNLSRSEITVE